MKLLLERDVYFILAVAKRKGQDDDDDDDDDDYDGVNKTTKT